MREMNASRLAIVPTVVDSGIDRRGKPYYVMPWYDEGSLEEAVLNGRFGDPQAGIQILLQLVDA